MWRAEKAESPAAFSFVIPGVLRPLNEDHLMVLLPSRLFVSPYSRMCAQQ